MFETYIKYPRKGELFSFSIALQLLKEGKEVRLSNWPPYHYISMKPDGINVNPESLVFWGGCPDISEDLMLLLREDWVLNE